MITSRRLPILTLSRSPDFMSSYTVVRPRPLSTQKASTGVVMICFSISLTFSVRHLSLMTNRMPDLFEGTMYVREYRSVRLNTLARRVIICVIDLHTVCVIDQHTFGASQELTAPSSFFSR